MTDNHFKIMPLAEYRDLLNRIAELEDKLSGKSAEVQVKLVEQAARIAELERMLRKIVNHDQWTLDARGVAVMDEAVYVLNGKPKENER